VKTRELAPDGRYRRVTPVAGVRAQQALIERAQLGAAAALAAAPAEPSSRRDP
jgi:hypothetical protein